MSLHQIIAEVRWKASMMVCWVSHMLIYWYTHAYFQKSIANDEYIIYFVKLTFLQHIFLRYIIINLVLFLAFIGRIEEYTI